MVGHRADMGEVLSVLDQPSPHGPLPFLDRTNEARAHVATLLRLRPGFTVREADAYYRMWCFAPSYREKMCDALRIGGLPGGGLAP